MKLELTILLLLAYCFSDFIFPQVVAEDEHFLNEWAAEITGGLDHARRVAEQYGYIVERALHSLPDHYLLKRNDISQRSRRSANHHTQRIANDLSVRFVEQQTSKSRVKRKLSDRALARTIVQKDDSKLSDPDFGSEWYLNPSAFKTNHRYDLRVKDCWKVGITGKGVVVTILDDGIERDHDDLKLNYDPDASYDFNDDDSDPNPRYEVTNENKHGTRCAGEVAMVANNEICGVGIAFDARIGGIRMLDGRVSDRLESETLSYNHSHIDIYSASWGPNDDGKTLEEPGRLAWKSFHRGILEGRGGKGVLYAWASGNGGRLQDNCNADGYTSSIYTMSVSGATQNGYAPWYGEKCSSTLTSTYSSGRETEGKVVSADLHGKCTDAHSGTSAAAPMAAGLMALLLEANPDLTWRDVQHIIVQTSRMEPLAKEHGWYKNAACYDVNLNFGFGLMDALGMVQLANKTTWKNVGKQRICKVYPTNGDDLPKSFKSGNVVRVDFTTDGCEGQENEVNYAEHVQLILDLAYTQRGRIYAELESPRGTIVTLMTERSNDRSDKGFVEWPLTSVHTWGENPKGTWKFRVMDKTYGDDHGTLNNATLIMYGTKEQPEYRKTNKKRCREDHKRENSVDDLDLVDMETRTIKRLLEELNMF